MNNQNVTLEYQKELLLFRKLSLIIVRNDLNDLLINDTNCIIQGYIKVFNSCFYLLNPLIC